MTFTATIKRLIDERRIFRVLRRGADDRVAIATLQRGLLDLGFDLRDATGAVDTCGEYGAGTADAVTRFAALNGVTTDGSRVLTAVGRLLVHRYWFLDDLRHLASAVNDPTVLARVYRSSAARVEITVLQEILNELGYGDELQWRRYGADGLYGKATAAAVRAFAADAGIACDGDRVGRELAGAALAAMLAFYGEHWRADRPPRQIEELRITESDRHLVIADSEHTARFTRYKRGVYTTGSQDAAAFVRTGEYGDTGLSASALNVIAAVAENEGRLDAINTWDNAILSFGMFQWTVGGGNGAAELPALLLRLKQQHPLAFEHYFGRHGLDIAAGTNATSGRFTLDGRALTKPADKQVLRDPRWIFAFWKSAQDPRMKRVQIAHALARLARFYRSPAHQVAAHDIADIITSEYGVALILDNHVNRPAYVHQCLQRAVAACALPADPAAWNSAAEQRLLAAYLDIRATYGRHPMTDAVARAARTTRARERGALDDTRGSFRE